MDTIRRIVLRHTAGPYPGLRQIMGLSDQAPGEMPDILHASFPPDNRAGSALRLKSTDSYVLYQEQVTA